MKSPIESAGRKNLQKWVKLSVWMAALTLSTLSFQQCAPAKFGSSQELASKAAVDDSNMLPEDVSADDSKKKCVDKNSVKVADMDGIPSAACLDDASKQCAVICHVPPGNPSAAHTIIISPNAIQAHLSHGSRAKSASIQCHDKKDSNSSSEAKSGDYLGECKNESSDAMVCQDT